MQRLPHVSFTNLYGPTEATIASSYYTVPDCPTDPTAAIPIGVACDGEQLLVLNEQLQPAPQGEIGDLYIRGVGLSPGYWNDVEKTNAAFLSVPLSDGTHRIYKTGDLASVGGDGLIYLHGRADSQIKSRGYRIELGEIEAALHATQGVKECAVVALDTDGFEGAVICCSVVPEEGSDADPTILRQKLSERLPQYMIPSQWICKKALPLNGNGKVDRPRLRDEFRSLRELTTTVSA
jgi:acyl-coenzyme A synthetase/AMP-(fatty) acid ligase